MKLQLALVSLLALSAITLFSTSQNSMEFGDDLEIYNKFSQWMMKYGNDSLDVAYRFPIFKANYEFIQQENAKQNDYFLALNQFAHMTNDEFKTMISSYIAAPESEKASAPVFKKTGNAVASSVDWVSKGVSGDVQNQGQCGGCWAFSVAQTLTSVNAINTGSLTFLSQQQILSCDHTFFLNSGCDGGNPFLSLKYYTAKKGLETQSDYPFTQVDFEEGDTTTCDYDSSKVFFQNSSATSITSGDVTGIKQAVESNPISIGINGGSIFFQLYGGGVLTNSACSDSLDHAVNIVGYDATASTPYWNIKNSWGDSWGEDGYIRIKITDGTGICGCQADASTASA